MMVAFSLVNAGLLPYLGLGAIPLVIYLFNRQRYRRVRWAAMEFLLRAMRKNRRRLRLENLLLLIVRTLIVLLFVMAMLRPVLDSGTVAQLGARSRRAELYVIDASASMGLRSGGPSLLAEAVAGARARIEKVLESGDVLGVFTAGGFPEPLFQEPQYVTDEGRRQLIDPLERLALIHEPFDVQATLQAVASWIERAPGGEALPWEIHIYTDLQRKDWLEVDGAPRSGVRDALADLEKRRARIVLHALGPARVRNATVTRIESASAILALDMPTSFQAAVVNHGREALAGLELELEIDGEVQGSRTMNLDAGAREQVAFPYIFRDTGEHRVAVRLRADDLEEDNRRYRVVEVRDAVRLLVADEGNEGGWLQAALEAESSELTGVRLTPYQVDQVPFERLLAVDLAPYEALILADVGSFTAAESEHIGAYVKAGGGLLVFAGERVQAVSYAEHAYRQGAGWFPFVPGVARVDPSQRRFYRWRVVQEQHPAVAYLARDPDSGLDTMAVWGVLPPAEPPTPDSVLVRLADPEQTPVVVEHRFGDGRVLSVGLGADRRWSNFPVSPAFVVFLYEALPYLIAPGQQSRNLSIGEPFRRVVGADEYAPRVFLFREEGGAVPLTLETRPDKSSFDLDVPGQESPGFYELRFGGETGGEGTRSEWLAVNADPSEGDLRRIPGIELGESYPALTVETTRTDGEAEDTHDSGSSELWRSLLYGVLALLVAESVMARLFGARTRA